MSTTFVSKIYNQCGARFSSKVRLNKHSSIWCYMHMLVQKSRDAYLSLLVMEFSAYSKPVVDEENLNVKKKKTCRTENRTRSMSDEISVYRRFLLLPSLSLTRVKRSINWSRMDVLFHFVFFWRINNISSMEWVSEKLSSNNFTLHNSRNGVLERY